MSLKDVWVLFKGAIYVWSVIIILGVVFDLIIWVSQLGLIGTFWAILAIMLILLVLNTIGNMLNKSKETGTSFFDIEL